MRLESIEVGEILCIQIHSVLHAFEFYTQVINKDDSFLYFKPVISEGKMLDFSITERKNCCDIIVSNGVTESQFKNVIINNVKDSYGNPLYHSISTKYEDVQECPKYIVNIPCAYNRGQHKGVTVGVIRDISNKGITLITDGIVEVGQEPTFTISFPDEYICDGPIIQKCRVVKVADSEIDSRDYDEYKSKKLIWLEAVNKTRHYQNWIKSLEDDRLRNLRGKS